MGKIADKCLSIMEGFSETSDNDYLQIFINKLQGHLYAGLKEFKHHNNGYYENQFTAYNNQGFPIYYTITINFNSITIKEPYSRALLACNINKSSDYDAILSFIKKHFNSVNGKLIYRK